VARCVSKAYLSGWALAKIFIKYSPRRTIPSEMWVQNITNNWGGELRQYNCRCGLLGLKLLPAPVKEFVLQEIDIWLILRLINNKKEII
jgi:hypothetical protein